MPARRAGRRLVTGLAVLALACGGDGPVVPSPPTTALRFAEVTAGYFHTCGLTPAGSAWCWGGNDAGTLGDGTRTRRSLPTAVADAPRLASLDAGGGHTCGLTPAGRAWCWGHNDEGQLGDGSFQDRDRPVTVAGGHLLSAVSAGHAHTCALGADGSAWCWGDDSRGQLGDGPSAPPAKSALPLPVQLEQPLVRIVAGYYQTCGLTATGAAWCWGANESGQLGDGTTSDRHRPVPVAGAHRFDALAAGDRFACALSGQRTWCWGSNRHQVLGSAAGEASPLPLRVDGVPSAVRVYAGAGAATVPGAATYACAVASDGRLRCWGGAVRALRDASAAPTPIPPDMWAGALAAGAQHLCALDRRGYCYCGGANYSGQLGDGTRTDRASLVPVSGPAGS